MMGVGGIPEAEVTETMIRVEAGMAVAGTAEVGTLVAETAVVGIPAVAIPAVGIAVVGKQGGTNVLR